MREHIGLAFRGSGAVAAHRWKNERLRALRFPEVDDGSHDSRDVRDASATHTERDARPRLDARTESGCLQFAPNRIADVGNFVIRKMLANGNQPGKLHVFRIRASVAARLSHGT